MRRLRGSRRPPASGVCRPSGTDATRVLDEIVDAALVATSPTCATGLRSCCRSRAPGRRLAAAARLHRGRTAAACAAGQPISAAVDPSRRPGGRPRPTFDNSMNYRSAVVFGVAEVLPATDQERALRHPRRPPAAGTVGRGPAVDPARSWRRPAVLRRPLDHGTASRSARRTRTVGADDGEDRTVWAGVLPLARSAGSPRAAARRPATGRCPTRSAGRPAASAAQTGAAGASPSRAGPGCRSRMRTGRVAAVAAELQAGLRLEEVPSARSPVRSTDQPMQTRVHEVERQTEAVQVLPAVPLLVLAAAGVVRAACAPRCCAGGDDVADGERARDRERAAGSPRPAPDRAGPRRILARPISGDQQPERRGQIDDVADQADPLPGVCGRSVRGPARVGLSRSFMSAGVVERPAEYHRPSGMVTRSP